MFSITESFADYLSIVFVKNVSKWTYLSPAANPSITATSIVCNPSGPMFVNLTGLLLRAAVESFDAKLPVQSDAGYSHSPWQCNFVIVSIGFSAGGCCLNVQLRRNQFSKVQRSRAPFLFSLFRLEIFIERRLRENGFVPLLLNNDVCAVQFPFLQYSLLNSIFVY